MINDIKIVDKEIFIAERFFLITDPLKAFAFDFERKFAMINFIVMSDSIA